MKKIGTLLLKISLIFCITLGASFFAFEKIYENLKKPEMQIVLVNEDKGTFFQSQSLSFGNSFVKQVERDTRYNWTVTNRGVAETRLANNEADVMVIIPSDFSQKATAVNEVTPEQLSLIYKINPMSTFLQATQAENVLIELEKNFNQSITEVYFASALQNIDDTKSNVNRMIEEEKAHTAIIVNEINPNVAKMTENFTTVKLSSENDVSRLEGLVSSLESFNEKNMKNKEDIASYQGNYQAFEAVYLKNNSKLTSFAEQSLEFNNNVQAAEHQTNLAGMSDSMVALQNYLTGEGNGNNTILKLQAAETKVQDSIQTLKNNRTLLDEWLNKDGLLDTEVSAVTTEIEAAKIFPENNLEARKKIEERIKTLCEVDNIKNVSLLANRANDACKKIGYTGKETYTSSFKGIAYFVVDAKDDATLELSVADKDATITFDACATVVDAMDSFVSKDDSNVEALHCSDVQQVNPIDPNNQVITLKSAINDSKQQLFAIQYTVTSTATAAEIDVEQKLVVKILPAEKPTVYIPDTGKNVTINGKGILGATIIITIGTEEYKAIVDIAGNWGILLDKTDLSESDSIQIHQEVETLLDDGSTFMNPSEIVTIKASNNPPPEVAKIKSGKNSYIVGTGTPTLSPTQSSIVEVILPSGLVLTSTIDGAGNWKLISPEILVAGDLVKVRQLHEISGVTKASPEVTKIVRDTIEPTVSPVEAGMSPQIGGMGEPEASIKVYLKDIAADGNITLSSDPIGEAVITADADAEEESQEWELTYINPIQLLHGQKLQIIQTDIYGNVAGEVEVEVQDTSAPKIPVVTIATGDSIKGTGEPEAELTLTVNAEVIALTVDSVGNWSTKLTPPKKLIEEDKIQIVQKDKAGNISDDVNISIGTEDYQNILTVTGIVEDGNTLSGTAIAESKIEIYHNSNITPTETIADLEGNWSIELPAASVFTLHDTVSIKQTTKEPAPPVKQSKTIIAPIYTPSIVTYNMTVRTAMETENFSRMSKAVTNPTIDQYRTFKKTTTLNNQNTTLVETTPTVIDEYFKVYYGLSVEDILSNSTITSQDEIQEQAKSNDKTLYFLLQTDGNLITNIITALESFKGNINTSLSDMKTETQASLDVLDGPTCVDDVCLGGVDEMLHDEISEMNTQSQNLADLQQRYTDFQNTFTQLQTQSNDVTTTLNSFTVDKAEEAPLLFEVTDQHVKMLEQAVSLQENAANYHQSATGMKESATTFAGKTGEMTTQSLVYLQELQQSTTSLQENVENNSFFSENLLTVFANSQINGIENNDLYGFMSNPVKKENYSTASYTGMTLFPYFTMIISFILSLMMAYSFLNWKRKVEMVYADEYVGDVLKSNMQKVMILTVIATIVSIIIGLISAFMAELLGWQLLTWVVTLICIINALTHTMYYLLRQFKSAGLFIILGIFLVYLLSSQTLGVYISEGTILAKVLGIFPLVYLEKFLFMILYGTSLTGTSSLVIGIFATLVVSIGLSMTPGVVQAKKIATEEMGSIRSK